MHTLKHYWLGANYALYLALNGSIDMGYKDLNMAIGTLQAVPGIRHILRNKIRGWATLAAAKTTSHKAASAHEKTLAYIQLTWAHIRAHSTRADTEKSLMSARNLVPWITTNTKEERLWYADSLKKIGDLHMAMGGVYEALAPAFYQEATRERAAAGQQA